MRNYIAQIALVIDDYDEAIAYYTKVLDFDLIEDAVLSDTKRWVLVAPKGAGETCLLLAKAKNEEQKARVGDQTGGRVFLFLHTDDFDKYYQHLKNWEVEFVRPRTEEVYGIVAVFKDKYGNLWDLIQPSKENAANKLGQR